MTTTRHESEGAGIQPTAFMNKLRQVVPDEIYYQMLGCCERFSINTPLRASHFLAQVKHESANFKFTKENLNYSAVALMNVFGKYFPSMDTAKAYARQPEKIANKVYANRMGNGNEASGDGWNYRGRGYIQLTGKDNYFNFFASIREPELLDTPDIVAEPKYACLSAGWFWDINKLNNFADSGSTEQVVMNITKRVNGGLNGITDRIKYFNATYKHFTETNTL